MKILINLILISVIPSIIGCQHHQPINKENLKTEIYEMEKSFEAACKTDGIAAAFYAFADSNAVIKRQNDTLIVGKSNIRDYYDKPIYQMAEVNWTADFIDISDDGSMAYTYGKYLWKFQNPDGKTNEFRGVFHTIWKKQSDGKWKYVWD